MKKLSVKVLLVATLLTVANIRCSSGAKLLSAGSPVISSLAKMPSLSTITSLLQTPGLGNLLGDVLKKPFTLLAPSNDALNSLGSSVLSNLTNPSNINQIASLLKDHIIPGKLDAGKLLQSGLTAASGKGLNLGGVNLGTLIDGGKKFNVFPIDKVLGG